MRGIKVMSAIGAAGLVLGLGLPSAQAEGGGIVDEPSLTLSEPLGKGAGPAADGRAGGESPDLGGVSPQPLAGDGIGHDGASGGFDDGVMAAGRADRTAVLDDVEWSAEAAVQSVDSVTVRHAANGVVTADITFEGAPSTAAPVRVDVYIGVWDADENCVTKYELRTIAGAGAQAGLGSGASWAGNIPATIKQTGARVLATSGANAQVGAANWNCAWGMVAVNEADTWYLTQTVYAQDLAFASLAVTGIDAPVQGARKGKWLTVKFDIRNRGKGLAAGTTVKLSGKGLKFKRNKFTAGDLGYGDISRLIKTKVKLSKKKKKSKLVIAVSEAGGATGKRTVTIVHRAKPVKYKSLVGQYFWGFASTNLSSYTGWDNQTVRFVNKKFVYVGNTKKGKTPKCGKKSKTCLPYKYSAKTGKVKIAKKSFKVTTHGFSGKFGKNDVTRYYEPLTLPKKGTKFAADLLNNNWYGYCLITCTTTTTHLSFDKKGRFVNSSWSIGSWPGLGSTWSVVPPDSRGTYKILSAGRIQLKYADGKTKYSTIGFMRDVRGKASPKGVGLALDDSNYYWDD